MKRRRFLGAVFSVTGLGGLATLFTPGRPMVQHTVRVGRFSLSVRGPDVVVRHDEQPETIVWRSGDGGFLQATQAEVSVREFGQPTGSFTVSDRPRVRCADQTVEQVLARDSGIAMIVGRLSGEGHSVGYRVTFVAASDRALRMSVTLEGSDAETFNVITLICRSHPDEAFFGFGQQLTFFNQKGKTLPILVQEHGVGRGQFGLTQIVDLLADGGGGTPFTTEAPAPHYLSSDLQSLFLENTEYSRFDLTDPDRVVIDVHAATVTAHLVYGATPLDLITEYTAHAGRMRPLPDWTHHGAIVSAQGGTEEVRRVLHELTAAEVPLAGLWIQDWTGVRTTPAGQQLWWNWQLDDTHYPGWSDLVEDLNRRGARMLVYLNPFLSVEPGHDNLYQHCLRHGYLVGRGDGSPYLIRNTNFDAAMLDLTNPACRTWIKDVITTVLIGTAGASGWMADFGEALPFDAQLADGADPAGVHNRYPELWAQVNREAIDSTGDGTDFLFFNRSGFTTSPRHSTLFWLGDQLQNWNEYDGIKSAVVGLLSGGVSGFSLIHSDTGGYVSLSPTVAGHQFPVVHRTPELFMRWMELNAFTALLRTHVGLDPHVATQIDSTPEVMAHLKRCATIYAVLAPYRRQLIDAAATQGHPLVRHPFLHYPRDSRTYDLRYQFMLGPDLLLAPVVDSGATTVKVYLPASSDTWQLLWTGESAGISGAWHTMAAPLGRPAVLVRNGSDLARTLRVELTARGVN